MSITPSNTYSQEKRANAFPVLVEIGKEFTLRHNTEEEVLRFICEKAGRLMDAKNLVALLQKSDQLNVVLAFQDGHKVPLNQSVQEQLLRQVGRKKVECIIEQKRWILLRDKKQVQEMAESPEENYASWVGVPMCLQDRAIGAVVLYHPEQEGLYDEDDANILDAITDLAANEIENIRLFQLEQKARQQADALKEAARIINASMELQDVAAPIFDQLKKVLAYDGVSLQLIEGERRENIGCRGFSFEQYPQKLLKNVSDDKLVSKIVKSQKPLVLSETEKFPELWDIYEETRHIKSWIGAPLIFQDRVIGLLAIDHKQAGYYTDKTKEIVAAFANIVAPALVNSQLFKQTKTQLQQRINDFNDLRDIYQLVGAADFHILLEEILKKGIKFTSADFADVWLYESHSRTIHLEIDFEQKRSEQLYQKGQRSFNIDSHKSIVGYVVTNGKSYLCSDVKHDEHYWENELDVQSELAVPLLSQKKEVIGVLNFESRKLSVFTEEHQELLEALAAQAAVAIQDANLYKELNRLNKNRKVLIEIEQELSAGIHLKQKDILQLIYSQASKLPGMRENFSIALFDGATMTIEFTLAYQNKKEVNLYDKGWEKRFFKPEIEKQCGKTDYIIHKKIPLCLLTKAEVKQWGFHEVPGFKGFEEGKQAASWLGVPMKTGKKVLGVLATYHYEQEYFYTPDDIELFESLANHAALALENARMNDRLNVLLEIGKNITMGIRSKESEIMEMIYEQASQKLSMANFSVALYHQQTDMVEFVLASRHGQRIELKSEPGWESRTHGEGKTEWIIKNRSPLLLNTYQKVFNSEKKRHKDWENMVASGWLGVPMIVEDKVIGVLANYHYGMDDFYTKEDTDIFQALANWATIAIDHARLYEKQQVLIILAQLLTSDIRQDEKKIPRIIYENASKLMDTDNMYIALYDKDKDKINFPLRFLQKGEQIDVKSRDFSTGKGKTEFIIKYKKPLLIQTKADDEVWYRETDSRDYIGVGLIPSWLGVPMKIDEKILGVIATYNMDNEHVYTNNDLVILQAMANIAAIALDNVRLYKDLKDALEQKEKAEKDKKESKKWVYFGRIAGSLAHRIGNKGGMIRLCVQDLTQHLEENHLMDNFLKTQLDIITRNNQYLLELSQELFKPVKAVEDGLERTNVADCLDDALRYAAIHEDIKVFSQYEHALPFVYGNKHLVEVFVELISNAAEAMAQSPQKELTITAQYLQEKKSVEIRFLDTGRGIHPEDISILFELFFKNRSSQNLQTHGFGLWWIKTFLEEIQGNIQYEVNAQQGATFIIELPVTEK